MMEVPIQSVTTGNCWSLLGDYKRNALQVSIQEERRHFETFKLKAPELNCLKNGR